MRWKLIIAAHNNITVFLVTIRERLSLRHRGEGSGQQGASVPPFPLNVLTEKCCMPTPVPPPRKKWMVILPPVRMQDPNSTGGRTWTSDGAAISQLLLLAGMPFEFSMLHSRQQLYCVQQIVGRQYLENDNVVDLRLLKRWQQPSRIPEKLESQTTQ